jgi:hypothetical protein
MSDDKSDPVDDLKQGLGLLFKAAKGAVEKLPTEKLEDTAKTAAKEVSRAFETVGAEVQKAINKATGSEPPPPNQPPPNTAQGAPPAEGEKKPAQPPAPPVQYDDGYAPEPPPKGPRIG